MAVVVVVGSNCHNYAGERSICKKLDGKLTGVNANDVKDMTDSLLETVLMKQI